MRIVYLLEGTELFGGVKVALRQANLLARRGHRVTVLAKGPEPDWMPVEVELRRVGSFAGLALEPEAVCVATYWTTLPAAAASGAAPIHYCQGYEASYTHNRDDHPAIEDAYRLPLPAMTVSPHLTELLERRFGRPARTVAQPLEPFFRPALAGLLGRLRRRRPGRPPRVLVPSPFEIDWKGVETALRSVAELRRRGVGCTLVRLTQWPPAAEEARIAAADEVHVGLDPPAVARLLPTVDLVLAPSWEQEGFGLPVLEAMAAGVPVVASDIAAFRAFAAPAAVLVPPRDPAALAAAAAELLAAPAEWRRRRRLGLAAAANFTEERAAREAEEALRWAAGRPVEAG